MSDRISGRWALVTGAASGIGEAIARALAARGAHVILCDIDAVGAQRVAASLTGAGARVEVHVVDVSDRAAMLKLASHVIATHGAPAILVNNAGIALEGPLLDTSLAQWDRMIGVNLMGVIHGCHCFGPAMQRAGEGGHIVNIASVAGLVPMPMLGAYTATKFAVVGLSEVLARELEPHGIGVSAICPGLISTNIVRSMSLTGADAAQGERLRALYQRSMARGASTDLVARAVVRAIEQRQGVVAVTAAARVMAIMHRVAPATLPRLLQAAFTRSKRGA